MGYAGFTVDTGLELSKVILGLTLLVIIFQLISHATKGIYWVYRKVFDSKKVMASSSLSLNISDNDAVKEENDSNLNLFQLFLIGVIRYALAVVYICLIGSFFF
jgi:hypothetical protein